MTNPFKEETTCNLIRTISTSELIADYKKEYQMDVSQYFGNLSTISFFECTKSKLKFFEPETTMGDSAFYEKLEVFDWYYMDWKWEQEVTKKLLTTSNAILEIGSGKGNFIKKLTEEGYKIKGIELNEKQVETGKKNGLNVERKYLHEVNETFDVICSFQVFEHIPNLDAIIKDAVKLLNKDGRLIFSVPNMDAFIKYNDAGTLNFPPHHINWFYHETYEYIASRYGIKLEKIFYEPLPSYHFNWYKDYLMTTYFRNRFIKRLFQSNAGQRILNTYIKLFSKSINGHTVLAVYRK